MKQLPLMKTSSKGHGPTLMEVVKQSCVNAGPVVYWHGRLLTCHPQDWAFVIIACSRPSGPDKFRDEQQAEFDLRGRLNHLARLSANWTSVPGNWVPRIRGDFVRPWPP